MSASKASSWVGERSPLAILTGDLNKRPSKTIDWPGYPNVQVTLWRLTPNELSEVKKSAFDFVRDILKFTTAELAWDMEQSKDLAVTVHILAKALRDPKNPSDQFCKDARELWDKTPPDEINVLIDQYNQFCEERSIGHVIENPETEVDELVSLSKKGLTLSKRLSWFDGTLLRKLLTIAVVRLVNLTNKNSSESSS